MSHVLNNKSQKNQLTVNLSENRSNNKLLWQPSASLQNLKIRADLLAKVRNFFQSREVMEVETPLIASSSVTDPHIASFQLNTFNYAANSEQNFYLQTSPEYAMKRLLAAGSGAIYQICKAFRQGEAGNFHNPEFTMLEWYRPNLNHHQLMAEVDALFQTLLGVLPAQKVTYQQLFQDYLHIDPHHSDLKSLKDCARRNHLHLSKSNANENNMNRHAWLDLLLSHLIQPQLAKQYPVFVYDYPADQAVLARIRSIPFDAGSVTENTASDFNPIQTTDIQSTHSFAVAERFELYYQGLELANGYHELTDAQEQRQRFLADLQQRQQKHCPAVPIDDHLLAALTHGMPSCAGVAVGFDRLVMLACQTLSIKEVISFDWQRI